MTKIQKQEFKRLYKKLLDLEITIGEVERLLDLYNYFMNELIFTKKVGKKGHKICVPYADTWFEDTEKIEEKFNAAYLRYIQCT